jgi:hypothetical protein
LTIASSPATDYLTISAAADSFSTIAILFYVSSFAFSN